jgi:hypothetical protein
MKAKFALSRLNVGIKVTNPTPLRIAAPQTDMGPIIYSFPNHTVIMRAGILDLRR